MRISTACQASREHRWQLVGWSVEQLKPLPVSSMSFAVFLHKKFNTLSCPLVPHRVPICTESGELELAYALFLPPLCNHLEVTQVVFNHAQLNQARRDMLVYLKRIPSACQSQHTQQYIWSRLSGYSEYQVMISPAAFQGSFGW